MPFSDSARGIISAPQSTLQGRDHRNARILADGLARLPALSLDPGQFQTNIVIFEVLDRPAADLVEELGRRGVLCWAVGPRRIRLVTHYEVCEDDVRVAVDRVAESLSGRSAGCASTSSSTWS